METGAAQWPSSRRARRADDVARLSRPTDDLDARSVLHARHRIYGVKFTVTRCICTPVGWLQSMGAGPVTLTVLVMNPARETWIVHGPVFSRKFSYIPVHVPPSPTSSTNVV